MRLTAGLHTLDTELLMRFLDSFTFYGYKKLAIFTTNVDAENSTFGLHKCVCGARNPAFWVGAVRRMCFVYIDIVHLLIIDLYNLFVSKKWSSKRIVYKPKPNSISTFPHHISRSTFHINRIALWVCCCHSPFV